MSKYIENVNTYMSQMKIKQAYVSLKAGIETSKLSRLLTGTQDITSTDMEKIAGALGEKVDFFLKDFFEAPVLSHKNRMEFAFYAGEPKQEQEKFATDLVELIENADEILGAKRRLVMGIGE